MKTVQAKNIDEYIRSFPDHIRVKLEEMRASIRQAAPEAEEVISYAMPTYRLHGNLVHFAGYKTHIGFYPAPSGIEAFRKELSVYPGGKGSIQFPLPDPIPLALVGKIVKFRVKENQEKATAKKLKKIS